jgi:hypothetical protein
VNARDLFILIHHDQTLYELSTDDYRLLMLLRPPMRVPALAGQRLRFVHLNVAPDASPAERISRSFFRYLSFLPSGEVDRDAYFNPFFNEFARALSDYRAGPRTGNVIEAASRFELNADRFTPDADLLARLKAIVAERAQATPFKLLTG